MTTLSTTAIPPGIIPNPVQASTVELSIRLMHTGVKPDEALKVGHTLHPYTSPVGKLFYETSPAEPPIWASFLEAGAPGIKAKLSGQHASAVLLLEAGPKGAQRLFAICFGQGHHAVETDYMERQFGLRVVLNSVSRNNLRVLDGTRLDATVIQRRTQASRESDLSEFGFDTHSELLRMASGKPADATLAKAMTGKDAVQIRKKIAFSQLPELCRELLDRYNGIEYKKDFKFIDQLTPVPRGRLSESLDKLLHGELVKLVNGGDSELHLAVPDILPTNASAVLSYFGSHLPHKKEQFADLAIEDYISELKKAGASAIKNMDDIRTHEVRSRNTESKQYIGNLKVYDCMVYETMHDKRDYVLFDGQWYEVSKEYRDEVEAAYKGLLKPAFVESSSARNERELIAELSATTYPDLLCIDQSKVNPKGVSNANLEPCDFLSRTKQLIHLKDSEASAPLSHLWSQGLNSAEALVSDSKFRTGFRDAAKKREADYGRSGFVALLPTAAKITPSEYAVVYGVLKPKSKRTGHLNLPFFSKVALRAAAERITLMGFPVELHLIEKR